MNVEDTIKKILNVDWARFDGPELYESHRVAEALIALAKLDDSKQANEVLRKVTYAIGNDHAGTYYPAILEALDILISLEKNSDENKARKICAGAILNNLYYFEPELGGYSGCTSSELKQFAIKMLQPYSDDQPA